MCPSAGWERGHAIVPELQHRLCRVGSPRRRRGQRSGRKQPAPWEMELRAARREGKCALDGDTRPSLARGAQRARVPVPIPRLCPTHEACSHAQAVSPLSGRALWDDPGPRGRRATAAPRLAPLPVTPLPRHSAAPPDTRLAPQSHSRLLARRPAQASGVEWACPPSSSIQRNGTVFTACLPKEAGSRWPPGDCSLLPTPRGLHEAGQGGAGGLGVSAGRQ